MLNESKLWQLRAGLITEGEYMEEMDSMDEADPADKIVSPEKMKALGIPQPPGGKQDPNVAAIEKHMGLKTANLRAIDTAPEYINVITKFTDMVQKANSDALSNQEVSMGLRKLLQTLQQKIGNQ